MIGFYLHSAGFVSASFDTAFLHVEPAYFFGWSGRDIKPFYTDRLRLGFRSLYVRGDVGNLRYRVGKLPVPDTGNLLLDPFSTGYDALSLSWAGDGWEYTVEFMRLGSWVSDGEYYFNPDATAISRGQVIDRYATLRTFTFGNFSFSEITVLSTLAGRFPDIRAFNPLLPGYLYQWFYAKEVNVLWSITYRFGRNTLRLIVDDFPYLPSWFSIVPPTVGVRVSGNYGSFSYDILWISAFTYANRRPWDALYESPYFRGDRLQGALKVALPGRKLKPLFEIGGWAEGRYNGVFKEPEIGEYPPFSFLHDPVRADGWVSVGLRYGRYEVQVGYGGKPLALNYGRVFLYFSAM